MFIVIPVVFFVITVAVEISTVWELNAAIDKGSNNKIGFLTMQNYIAVKSLLHSNASPEIFADLASLEEAVINGYLISGVSSSRPADCEKDILCFASGLVTTRGIMFAPGVSHLRKKLINRGLVLFFTNGIATSIQNEWAASHGIETVNVHDCTWESSAWNVTGLSAHDNNFRVASILADWGYQGNYFPEDPTGFWPEVYNGIEASSGLNFTRQYYSGPDEATMAIKADEADITEPYWSFGGSYKGQPRIELFDKSCTVLGTDSVFFVKRGTNPSSNTGVASWVVILTSISGGLVFCVCVGIACFTFHLIQKEKDGKPVFMTLTNKDGETELASVNA